MRQEHDSRVMRVVVRGESAARYRERPRIVRLADDVGAAFADEAAVDDALREYPRTRPGTPAPASPVAAPDRRGM